MDLSVPTMPPASAAPSGRSVIVTGALGGIGSAIVAALSEAGSAVAACDAPGTDASITFDVRDRAAIARGVADAIESLGGRCDGVVANAGIVDTIHRAERFSEDEWRKDLEVNLYGAFYVVQEAYEALVAAPDARVVLISSVAAEIGIPGQVAYGASKAGLVGLARTLASEWGPRGIRCNVVMPGFIATPKVLAMPPEAQEGALAGVPLGRLGATEELAGTVGFLLSAAGAYINGAVVRVDGGLGLARR
jgi:NAD(P)-dependent dehydrogenase (short-subunit alcohol dehydrogenase family)